MANIETYIGRHIKTCKVVVATKLYPSHKGASIRTFGLRNADYVVLTQSQTRALIKQLRAAIK